jgi:hypothetical protein
VKQDSEEVVEKVCEVSLVRVDDVNDVSSSLASSSSEGIVGRDWDFGE